MAHSTRQCRVASTYVLLAVVEATKYLHQFEDYMEIYAQSNVSEQ